MADETMYGDHGFLSIVRGGSEHIRQSDIIVRTLVAGSDTVKAGMALSGDGMGANTADHAITTDKAFLGICLGPVSPADTYDLDDVITDGTLVKILKPCGLRTKVAVFYEAVAGPIALVEGDKIAVGTEAGKVRKFVYADATAATDSFDEFIGTSAEVDAGSTDTDHVIVINY